MKKLLSILFAGICFFSCTNTKFEINGTADKKMDGTTVFLKQRINRVWTSMDSVVVKDGKFAFNGVADTAKIAYISFVFPAKNKVRQAFILENGKISVAIDTTGILKFSGTKLNDALQVYQNGKNEFNKKAEIVYKAAEDTTLTPEKQTELNAKIADLEREEVSIDKKFAISNINTLAGTFIFTNSFYAMSTVEKESIVRLMNDKTKENQRIKEIIADIATEKSTAVGNKFTDIKLPSVAGDSLALSDLVGKTDYVMIDFWASWCGPCMHSLPELKKIYNIYKGTRFQILGVSLDENADAWKGVISGRQLGWKHISDLKGWKCAGSRAYAVNSIPSTVLIDKNGKIVGRNLNFDELRKILSGNTTSK